MRFGLLAPIRHGISNRHGGVSQSRFATLNMSAGIGDDADCVDVNRRRFLSALGLDPSMILSGRFSHGAEVTVVPRTAHLRDGAETMAQCGSVEGCFRSDAVVSDS